MSYILNWKNALPIREWIAWYDLGLQDIIQRCFFHSHMQSIRGTVSPVLWSSVMCGIVTLMHLWDREVQHSPRICCCCLFRPPVSSNDVFGVSLKALGKAWFGTRRKDFTVSAKFGKMRKHDHARLVDLNPNVKGGVFTCFSYLKPLKEKLKQVALDFEKPLLDPRKKTVDV